MIDQARYFVGSKEVPVPHPFQTKDAGKKFFGDTPAAVRLPAATPLPVVGVTVAVVNELAVEMSYVAMTL